MDTKKFLDQDGLTNAFGVVAGWIRSGSLVLLCDTYDPQGGTTPIDLVDGSGVTVSTESVIVPGITYRKAEGVFAIVNLEINDSGFTAKHYKSWKDCGVYGPKNADGCVVPVAGKYYLCTGDRKIYRWTGTEMTVFATLVPEATSGTKGIASFGNGLSVSNGNVTLKKATSTDLGGVKIGDGLSVDSTGKIAVNAGTGLKIDPDTGKTSADETKIAMLDDNGKIPGTIVPEMYAEFAGMMPTEVTMQTQSSNSGSTTSGYKVVYSSGMGAFVLLETSTNKGYPVWLATDMPKFGTYDTENGKVVPYPGKLYYDASAGKLYAVSDGTLKEVKMQYSQINGTPQVMTAAEVSALAQEIINEI